VHGGALDARDFTRRAFHQFGLVAACLAPAQVHAQQHFGPVLRLGAPGTGLDVEVGVVDVHLAAEHALELEIGERLVGCVEIGDDGVEGVFVVLLGGEFEEFLRVADPRADSAQIGDGAIERDALLAQRLRAGGIVPDVGRFEFALDFDQAFGAGIEVKDTP